MEGGDKEEGKGNAEEQKDPNEDDAPVQEEMAGVTAMIGIKYVKDEPICPWEIKSLDEAKVKKMCLKKQERDEWINHH